MHSLSADTHWVRPKSKVRYAASALVVPEDVLAGADDAVRAGAEPVDSVGWATAVPAPARRARVETARAVERIRLGREPSFAARARGAGRLHLLREGR
ncbi:hypothetical protein GCM10009811_11170 [Nostocoides veronense]|uniref:Uncharacterized protein n=1 Tax=Nostocoides veronense TaxID=330836 RepID=A0ABP4XTS7_9MICO